MARLSLLDPEYLADPYGRMKTLRQIGPVVYLEQMNTFAIIGYEAAREVLMDPARFSSIVQPPGRSSSKADQIIASQGYGRGRPALQNNDRPQHSAYRALVSNAFRPRRIREMTDYIEDIVSELLDSIEDGEEAPDFVREFAVPLPVIVIADQLGVPREMYRQFKRWSDAWLEGLGAQLSEERMIENAHLIVEMQDYLAGKIEERRENPRKDILSDLATSKVEDELLDTATILAIVEQLLVAGNETTTNGIAAGLCYLSSHHDLLERLFLAPEEISEFVEEILRLESPVQGLYRRAVVDTEVQGAMIPKESLLFVHYGAANRDEGRFADPDEFDLDRPKKGGHIAFGSGIHHCVGSELARVEMRAACHAVASRFKELHRLDDAVGYHQSFALRGIKSLRLRFVPRKKLDRRRLTGEPT